MKVDIKILLIGVFTILGCYNDDIQNNVDGKYIGTFQRGENTSNVELTLNDFNFSGESEIIKFPAICNGDYSISGGTINFGNQCSWTAEFDWSLILNDVWEYNFSNDTLSLTNSIGDVYTLVKQKLNILQQGLQ